MLRIFTNDNKFFGYGYVTALPSREYVLYILDLDRGYGDKHYIKLDYCEYKQLVELKEGEGRQLLYGLYHDGNVLKYVINEKYIKGNEQFVTSCINGKSYFCNYKGEVIKE